MAIQVVATKLGFFGKRRREGEEFTIEKPEEFGSWMDCIDPDYEVKVEGKEPNQKRRLVKATTKPGAKPAPARNPSSDTTPLV